MSVCCKQVLTFHNESRTLSRSLGKFSTLWWLIPRGYLFTCLGRTEFRKQRLQLSCLTLDPVSLPLQSPLRCTELQKEACPFPSARWAWRAQLKQHLSRLQRNSYSGRTSFCYNVYRMPTSPALNTETWRDFF